MRTLSRVNPRRQLQASVADFSFACRRATAIRFLARGIAIGGVLAGLAGGFFTFFGFGGGLPFAELAFVTSIVVAASVGWLRPVSELRVALDIDRQLELGERVTTALEMSRLTGDRPLADQQMLDALAHLAVARPGAVYPIRLTRRAEAIALLGIVLAILPWVAPWPSLPGLAAPSSQVTAVSQTEAARLDDAANRLESQTTASDPSTRTELATQLRQAADALRRDGGNAQQATSDLQQTSQAVSSLSPRTGEPAALTLARISDALNNQSTTQPITQALDQQNVARAAATINQLAASLSSMSPAQRQDLANALQSAGDAARGSDTNASAQLQQAAQAARNGDAQGVRQAAQALQQLDAANQAQNDASQASSELQSSQQAVAQAGQSSLSQLSPAASPADAASDAQSSDQAPGQANAQGQPGQGQQQGDQSGNQQGGGIGTGTTDHLGAPNDPQGLAQREVTVPTGQQFDTGSVSASNQLQNGAGGEARVDYRNVLPQYQKQALQAIDGNAVPTGLKQVVKGYFDSLAAH
ncbi:MAG: hypothetical protein ACRDIY_15765 [Chloroflexota bacterium]